MSDFTVSVQTYLIANEVLERLKGKQERILTQSCDKNPYTQRKIEKAT